MSACALSHIHSPPTTWMRAWARTSDDEEMLCAHTLAAGEW
ncbi:hypothetical protein SEA_YAKULT_60 [Gordonia phage Yakult]|nr:hypothetical protein SEA_YAKULT_60 [Gordonia phage Yakult]